MKVKVKVIKEKDFQPTLHEKAKYWVYLEDGRYFYLLESHLAQWRQEYTLCMDYPSMDAAILEVLLYLHQPSDNTMTYRRLRVKPRTYTFIRPRKPGANKQARDDWEAKQKIIRLAKRVKKRFEKIRSRLNALENVPRGNF